MRLSYIGEVLHPHVSGVEIALIVISAPPKARGKQKDHESAESDSDEPVEKRRIRQFHVNALCLMPPI